MLNPRISQLFISFASCIIILLKFEDISILINYGLRMMRAYDNNTCTICLEVTNKSNITCADNHITGLCCLESYLSINVFPQVFDLVNSCGLIKCPVPECNRHLDSVVTYIELSPTSRIRYRSILSDAIARLNIDKQNEN